MSAFLISALMRSLCLGIAGLAVLFLFRRSAASVRHALAVGTVLSMLAVPVLSLVLPSRPLEISGVPDSVVYLTVTKVRALPTAAMTAPQPRDWTGFVESGAALLWLTVSLALLTRLALSLLALKRRVRNGLPVPLGNTPWKVVEDRNGVLPMMAWLGSYVVLLPPTWREWTQDRLDRVLLHEQAHARRGDWFTQVIMHLACALMWPNPVMWLLTRKARQFAEHAADDLVLASGAEPSKYASDLLEIARDVRATYPAFTIPMAAKADVARRIEMVLNTSKKRGAITLAGLLIGGIAATGFLVPLASSTVTAGQASTTGGRITPSVLEPSSILIKAQFIKTNDTVKIVTSSMTMKGGSNGPTVIMMPIRDVEKLVAEQLKGGAKLMSSPIIRTLDGMAASISMSGLEGANYNTVIEMTPSLRKDGGITIQFNLETRIGDKADRLLRNATGTASIPKGEAAIILERKPNAPSILTVLTPSVFKD